MINFFKFLWLWIKSPMFRWWISFYQEQEILDRFKNEYEDNIRLRSYPMYLYENGKMKKV